MSSTATPKAVEERVFEILSTFGADPESINRDATFEDIDIDSLDLVELSQIVEEEYGVEVTSEDAEDLQTVGEAIDLIVGRMS
jgi:acyl carrier protein